MIERKIYTELNTDTSMLDEKEKELVLFSTNYEWGTPEFKFRHFVGDAQITPYAKIRQFIVEIRSREEVIEQLQIDLEKNAAAIEVEKEKIQYSNSKAEKKLCEVEIKRLSQDSDKILRRMHTGYQERQSLLNMIKEMYENGEAYLEDGTEIIDIIGTAREDELEKEYWTRRLAKQSALDIMSYGQIGTGNMDAISMLSSDQQIETLGLAINWSVEITAALEKINKKAVEDAQNRERSIKINYLADKIKENVKQLEN